MAKNTGRRATPSAANRGVQTRPGDATGMEQERLRKENAPAIAEAATRTSLVNGPPVQQTDEVVDYTGGGSPHVGGAEGEARLITMDEAVADGTTAVGSIDIPDNEIDMDALPDGKTDILPEMVERTEEPQPAHGERRDSRQDQHSRPQQVEAPKVTQAHRVLRVNTDLEDITIGKDNHFTFRVGRPYKVDAHVYDHLAEKGYVLF